MSDSTAAMSKADLTSLLMKAATEGCTDVVRSILDPGEEEGPAKASTGGDVLDINDIFDEENQTLLMAAVQHNPHQFRPPGTPSRNDVALVRLLLEKGANVNATNINGATALMLAVRDSHPDVVRELVYRGQADVNMKNLYETTALIQGADYGKLAAVRTLLFSSDDIDVHASNSAGNTALTFAAHSGRIELMALLMEHGADDDVSNFIGMTPLSYASSAVAVWCLTMKASHITRTIAL